MHIRQATLADIPAILAIVRKVVPIMRAAGNLQWDDVYPNADVFTRDIELNQLWVAEHEQTVAGVAALTTDQEPEYAQVGWDLTEQAIVVHRLAVDPAAQGLGIARALMQQAELLAIVRNITILRVDTSAQNAITQALFPKLGYLFAGEIGLHFRAGLRVFCYEKRLPDTHKPLSS
jgi:ribosomal protein S18 acetylase RimI-like enzyme